MILAVQPFGAVDETTLNEVVQSASSTLGFEARVEPQEPDPVFAWDARRRQYSSFEILRAVARLAARPGVARVLGVTEYDLFIPALTFVFGQAQLDGGAALVSFARLRQRFYGLPEDGELFRGRLRKEVTHELGHTLGLIHCSEPACAMRLSTDVLQVDRKGDRLCPRCAAAAAERMARWRQQDYEVAMEDPGRR